MRHIYISVRKLIEHVSKSGSIENSYMGNNRALEGIDIHKKLQGAENELYKKEVHLKCEIPYRDINFVIEGRADGIYSVGELFYVDEIKSTHLSVDEIGETNQTHWGQAIFYAYMLCHTKELNQVGIRLRYCQVQTFETIEFIKHLSLDELQEVVYTTLETYYLWAQLKIEWQIAKRNSIKSSKFPFAVYRKGQREMAVAVYQSIQEKNNLLMHAPTGIGKTMSTLYPTVSYMGHKGLEKIYYLTSKSTTKDMTSNAACQMHDKGIRLKTVIITAKEKICFMQECICDKENCLYAEEYYDKINDVLFNAFSSYDLFSRSVIEKIARENKVCPFELTLDLAEMSDLVICDYNYFYDPRAFLKRAFSEENNQQVVLVDEAHNLPDRVREMYSSELTRKDFLEASVLLKNSFVKEYKSIRKVAAALLSLSKQKDETLFVIVDKPESFIRELKKMTQIMDEWLVKSRRNEHYKVILELYFKATSFIKISELYSEDFSFIINKENGVKIKISCINPSEMIRSIDEKVRTVVFFSGTLIPLKYYKNIFGMGEKDHVIKFSSPFSQKKFKLLVDISISIKYKDRNNHLDRICEVIHCFVNSKKGNYLIFFPSYQFMESVYEYYIEGYNSDSLFIQKANMSEEEQSQMLSIFSERNDAVVFVVLGGSFSEGIDLKEEKLIGAMILGTGIPMINFQRDLIMQHYEKKYKAGFDFAYRFPGFNKLLQAAGRVIRTEEDVGCVLLVDDRLLDHKYQSLFPENWKNFDRVDNMNQLETKINNFWRENNKDDKR